MKKFKIFPSIGIGRIGGSSTNFFIAPEKENSLGVDFHDDGTESELTLFKDNSGLIKRQASRFSLFMLNELTQQYEEVKQSESIKIEWQVHLVNKKSAVVRPPGNQDPPATPPALPLELHEDHKNLLIDGGTSTVSGILQSGSAIVGKYKNDSVYLGELKTDLSGNLIILGGHGVAKSPSGKPVGPQPDPATGTPTKTSSNSFYYNEDWYDDTSDGSVTATVYIDGQKNEEVQGAWVIIAPPDYAPSVKGVITLFDIIEKASTTGSHIQPTSFNRDIKPLFENFKNHQWVHDRDYSMKYAIAELADNSTAAKPKRMKAIAELKNIRNYLRGYEFTDIQENHFKNYLLGNFTDDVPVTENPGESLTKLLLKTTIGQGFFPGIEGGIILENNEIYDEKFRLDHAKVLPGDITGLMALPWQADFLECQKAWWPTQRPDLITDSKDGMKKLWARTKNGPLQPNSDHEVLVEEFNRFGFVTPNFGKQLETERDETF